MEANPRSQQPNPNSRNEGRSKASHRTRLLESKESGVGRARWKAQRRSGGEEEARVHALFVAVDYTFLLAFTDFLAYLVGSRILPSVTSSA
ncbi:hypothetical protein C2845_PM06G12030 [Panicum miliaceum]|uniref:Uncharacterized protein n=1 Tax=Panicum miliaceum TaxID=4540 RepID=A0A3L6RG37_PANMI|nr:hypothetical protein C2845_PM06G12030 [Panicum miliaceum]